VERIVKRVKKGRGQKEERRVGEEELGRRSREKMVKERRGLVESTALKEECGRERQQVRVAGR